MLVLHDPRTFEHETVELLGAKVISALECPDRVKAILKSVSEADEHEIKTLDFHNQSEENKENTVKVVQLSHDPEYLLHLKTAHETWVKEGLITEDESILPECFRIPTSLSRYGKGRDKKPPKDVFARPGYYSFDMSSGISKHTWPAILSSVNLAIEAANVLVPDVTNKDIGEAKTAAPSVLALCRPPGHHCNTSMAGGYCYVNNVVVAIDALRLRLASLNPRANQDEAANDTNPRIAILDIDFHHGNGTQDAFYTESSVLYLSIHGEDEFPYYSGFEDELGEGEGYGYNCNFPLKTGASFGEYMEKLQLALGEIEAFGPEYLFVSLGFDTFCLDPLGKFQIETEDYAAIATAIRSSKAVKDIPSAILLEGGYVIDRLGANTLSFLGGWEDAEKGA